MPPKRIQDRFTKLPVSKQRKWQLRQKAKGKCEKCKCDAVDGILCNKHRAKAKKRYRCLTAAKETMEK